MGYRSYNLRTAYVWLILLAAIALLHGHVLNGWWRWDDATHLYAVTQYSPWAYFFDAQVWRAISPVNFTPLLNLSFQIDYTLFGFSPRAFYLRQLITLWLCSVLTFHVVRLWLPTGWALCAALLFSVATPVMFIAEQLMTRHYADGLVLALGSLLLFVSALRAKRHAYLLALAAAGLYLLAVLAKEVYAPLAVLLPFLREAPLRKRLMLWLPTLAMVGVYVVWRQHMLASTGGYGQLSQFDWVSTLYQLARPPLLLFGQHALGWVATGVMLLSWLAVALTRSTQRFAPAYALLMLGLGAGFVLLPLVPLTLWPGLHYPDRYVLLPWWAASVGIAWGLAQLAAHSRLGKSAALAMALVLMAVALSQTLRLKAPLHAIIHEQQTQGRFIWEADAEHPVWLSPALAATQWEYHPIIYLREIAGLGPAPTLIADESELATYWENQPPPREVWQYSADCTCMRNVAAEVPQRLAEWQARLRDDTPPEANITIEGNLLTWQFGPYQEGSYALLGPRIGRIPLPPQGQLRTSIELHNVRLRHDAPDGTIRYSDLITPTIIPPPSNG